MIIGIGHRARAGKDTVASYLVNNYGFIQESFAYPLKEHIGRQICNFTDKQLYDGIWKETIDPEWNMTPRQMLQLIGDGLRNIVNKNFWVIPMKRKLKQHLNEYQNIVISDVRYRSEADMIKELGGIVIKIHRPNLPAITGFKDHNSENELENYDGWNHIIINDGTIQELYAQIDNIFVAYYNNK